MIKGRFGQLYADRAAFLFDVEQGEVVELLIKAGI
jgi:hypothetical protein